MAESREVLLRVEHLKQYFGRLKAVDDVSFDIYKGEVFGLVGESGCGKTTTGRTIIKLYEPTGGDIWFNGRHIGTGVKDKKKQIAALRREGNIDEAKRLSAELVKSQKEVRDSVSDNVMTKMQMIFQDPIASLNPRMTVRQIISEGFAIRGIRDKAYIDAKVKEVLEMVGLVSEHAERYPHEFSGGQRQRIGIARSVIMQPEMIIADEPVSALDVSIQAQVINLLNDLRRELGLTILFIAHDLSVVKYFSDRIGVMYFGELVELATSDELFLNPLHPYTKSLLSAIPLPDPEYEKNRKRIIYNPLAEHDYSVDKPTMREVKPGHFVKCNNAEYEKYLSVLK